MRRTAGLLALPLAWFAAGCADGGSGTQAGAAEAVADTDRDLTTMAAEAEEAPVVSALELGLTKAPPEAPIKEAVVPVFVPEPALVAFTDGLEMGGDPQYIETALPILGAGSGTMLQPGMTVAAVGNPVDLFRPRQSGESPWPEARPGEFPSVSRNGIGLMVGRGGGGGHCPVPGM